MQHNNWNALFQLFTAMDGHLQNRRLAIFKGAVPDLSQDNLGDAVRDMVASRMGDWIATYATDPIYAHNLAGSPSPVGTHDTGQLGHIDWSHEPYFGVDWDNPEHLVRNFLRPTSLLAKNAALASDEDHNPTWFVLAVNDAGETAHFLQSASSIKTMGIIGTPSAPDHEALIHLVQPLAAGEVPTPRDFTNLSFPF